MVSNASTAGGIFSGFAVITAYMVFFWRVFRSNTGNRLVECGIITMVVFFAMVPFSRIPGFADRIPDRIFVSYILLLVLLCFATLFFLVQRIWQALIRCQRH